MKDVDRAQRVFAVDQEMAELVREGNSRLTSSADVSPPNMPNAGLVEQNSGAVPIAPRRERVQGRGSKFLE